MSPPTAKNNAIEMSCLILYVLSAATLLYASPVVFCSILIATMTFKALQDIHERRILYPSFLETIPNGMEIVSMDITTVIPYVTYHLHASFQGESFHFDGEFVTLIHHMKSFRVLHKV